MSKLVPLERLSFAIPRPIVMAHGCFDYLHWGHIRHLEAAKRKGMTLVVTVTADRYVNKGAGRPIFNQQQRAEMLAALSCVDYVAINDASDASRALKIIRPDFYIKGQDYKTVACDEFNIARSVGAEIIFTDTEKFSSTALIERLRA